MYVFYGVLSVVVFLNDLVFLVKFSRRFLLAGRGPETNESMNKHGEKARRFQRPARRL